MNKSTLFSILLGVLFVAIILGSQRQNNYETGLFIPYAELNAEEARRLFGESASNEDLVAYLKILCGKYETDRSEQEIVNLIKEYGTKLFDRARRGEIDLSKAGDEELMLSMMQILRECGVD